MIRKVLSYLSIIFLLSTIHLEAQGFSNLWKGHFSFTEIVDVTLSPEKVYAASENAVFSYNLLTNEIESITTIEGLSGQRISTISYSDAYQLLLIGYENGLIELFFENTREIRTVVDILERENITPVNRRINNFFVTDDLVFIATNYGISVYDLEGLEFGDTYFLGDGGAQIIVNQVTVYNNELYAACLNNNGIKKGDLNNPNLIDFDEWEQVLTGNFQTINTLSDNVFAVGTNRGVYNASTPNPTPILSLPDLPLNAEVSDAYLIYATGDEVRIYNDVLSLVRSFVPNEEFDTEFNAAVVSGNEVYIGSQDFGLLYSQIDVTDTYISIVPNGPLKNNVFRIDASTGIVWATFGAFTGGLNPFPLNSEGVSYLRGEEWNNIPFDSLLGARELNKITPNPNNPSQVFISSFKDGILELNNFEATVLYDESNSGLESLILPGDPDFKGIRVSGAEFDNSGLLWSITSRVDRPIKSYDNSSFWQGFSFSDLISDPLNDEIGFYDLVVDNAGTKWTGAFLNGLIAYNESKSNSIRNLSSQEQNLPNPIVPALALDNRNQLWVGTSFGLRVLFNTTGFFEDPNPSLSSIIILEDGIPRELLDDQYITDIKVDGSNNKWIGTIDSGIFYFSPNGQETIYHFTEDNSPLPSNAINDISVNPNNGEVYIATDRGLVSFLAGGSAPEQNLDGAFVYPNPVRPEYEILGFNDLNDITKGVKIEGLTEDVNIKITDVEGNLVAEAQSRVNLRSSTANYNFAVDGGTAIWNGKNLANNIVSSGVYIILITDLDSFETKVLKLLIIR